MTRVWCGGTWTGDPFRAPAMAELRAGVPDLLEGSRPEGEVLFGQPDPAPALANADLRWIQITSAGYTKYDSPEFWRELRERGVAFTNSSSVFDEPCAQHVLAFMLAHARRLPQSLGDRAWRQLSHRDEMRLLGGERCLIVGYGAIGRRLAELLAPFDMEVEAVRRHPRGDEGIPMHETVRLDERLPFADYVVNALPASPETERLFDEARFARMKSGAAYLSIGRGATTNQDALLAALPRLGAAYLDVTDPEPLPPDHPLWEATNVFITPHTGGGHRDEETRLVRHFLANLARFRSGEPLRDRVV